jgi:hypothetical protein
MVARAGPSSLVDEELHQFFMRPERPLAGDADDSADPVILLPRGDSNLPTA